MGNKLRALFEDEEQQYVQKIKFKDEESYTKFVESITRLQREGKGFKAEGIESAKTLLKMEIFNTHWLIVKILKECISIQAVKK